MNSKTECSLFFTTVNNIQCYILLRIMRFIVKAEGLKSADRDGKSDPFVKLKVHGTTFQTKTVKHNLNPEWNEKFEVKKVPSGTSLTFEIYDEDLIHNDFLGEGTYTLTEDEKPREVEKVLDVIDKGRIHGTITVVLYIRRIQYNVNIEFLRGSNLKAADHFIRHKSDPYLIAQLLSVSFTTQYVSNTLDPEWNEKWSVNNVPAGSKLQIQVFDKDYLSKDDPMGVAEYTFEDNEPHDSKKNVTLDVIDGGKKQGTLSLTIHFNDPLPVPK